VPRVEVFFYQESRNEIPLIAWLDRIPEKAQRKCLARLQRLEEMGWDLRRPEADFLREGIYELRASYQGIHYRMLYFFFLDRLQWW
jgi:phage-related protein